MESDSRTLRRRSFVRGKRNCRLGAKWRTSKHQHYLLALKFMSFKRSNRLCQKELQEHSILGTRQALRQGGGGKAITGLRCLRILDQSREGTDWGRFQKTRWECLGGNGGQMEIESSQVLSNAGKRCTCS